MLPLLLIASALSADLQAMAGQDFMAYPGQTVELAGAGSGADELDYDWLRRSGPPSELDDPSSASPRFTPAKAGSYVWELRVRAGKDESPADTVTVVVVQTETPKLKGGCSSAPGGSAWVLGLAGLLGLVWRRR